MVRDSIPLKERQQTCNLWAAGSQENVGRTKQTLLRLLTQSILITLLLCGHKYGEKERVTMFQGNLFLWDSEAGNKVFPSNVKTIYTQAVLSVAQTCVTLGNPHGL